MANVVEEIVLLAYDDDKGTNTSGSGLDLGMAGAALMDLALLGRINVTEDEVIVVDERPTGNKVLDEVLAKIGASTPRKPDYWVNKLCNGISKRVRNHMVERKMLYTQKAMVGGLIPYTRYLPTSLAAEREVRDRLESAVRQGHANDVRTAALAGAINALWIEKSALPDMPYMRARAELQKVSGDCRDDAVDASIQATTQTINTFLTALAGTVTAGMAVSAMGE